MKFNYVIETLTKYDLKNNALMIDEISEMGY